METTETTTQLIPVSTFKQIVDAAPEALQMNEESVNKAVTYGESLLAEVSKSGMSDDIDAKANNYLVKLRNTMTTIQDRRKPLTQLFDQVRSVFTSLEAKIDPKVKDSVYARIQKIRDDHAAEKMRIQREMEAEARRKLDMDKERVELQSYAENAIRLNFNSTITNAKSKMNALFNSTTLENFSERKFNIENYNHIYTKELFDMFVPVLTTRYLSKEDVPGIIATVKEGKFGLFASEYKNAIETERRLLMDRLPGRKKELEAIAAANEAEANRMKEAAAQRQKDEEARLLKEAEDARIKADQESEANKQVGMANALFENEMTKTEIVQPTAMMREGYEIQVMHPVGYMQIVAFYFEREGKNESVEKLEKKTLGAMKTFCEKVAHKTGEKINNPYIVYTETFKTVAKK